MAPHDSSVEQETNTVCDADLHAAWQAGDRDAAITLVLRYRERICGLGQRLGLSADEAEDLAHHVLLEAYRSPFEARAGATYFGWLARIARRHAARRLEEKRRRPELGYRRPTTPRTNVWRSQLAEQIQAMPETQAKIFARLAVGCTPSEISRELGIPASTVRTHIHRGRLWLRAQER